MERSPQRPVKFLDQVRQKLRLLHYTIRTEEAYVDWIRRYILFHHKRHPGEMGGREVEAFLTHLAVEGHVAASTHNQALAALLFLYQKVLAIEFHRSTRSAPNVPGVSPSCSPPARSARCSTE